MSLFYPDVVIGRPGARCDALEAQSMIVCIPGARGLILWPTSEVRGAWLTVLDLSFDLPGYIDEVAPKWSRFCVLDIHYFTPRTSHLSPITSHYERQPVGPSARRIQFLTPRASQQTIALVNMPFSPVPKARGRGRRWIWGPCK